MTQNINTAALKVAAIENIALFVKFAAEFNTYDMRNSQGLEADRAGEKAMKALVNLQNATGENIILRDLRTKEDSEEVLDELYHMLKLVSVAKN